MGRRISVIVDGRLQVLWDERIEQPHDIIETPHNQKSKQADEAQNPAMGLPAGNEMLITKNQPTAEEKRHRATEERYWKQQLRYARQLNLVTMVSAAIGAFSIVLIVSTLALTIWQADIADKTFKATQRAAVYLGLLNGRFVEFVSEKEILRVVLYFRNYGSHVAYNTLIDVWPVLTSVENNFAKIDVPPSTARRIDIGPDIPPEFEYSVRTEPVSITDRVLYETGKVSLKINGRIIYRDDFGFHCNTFSAGYEPSLQSFRLMSARALCDGRPHELLFCQAGDIVQESERPDDSLKIECTKEGFLITKVK